MAGSGLFNHHKVVDARLQGARVSAASASREEKAGQAEKGTSEWRVSILKAQVSGAGNGACNAIYKFDMMHQGKPLFKSSEGAIIYFNKHWKMNTSFKTTSWLYSVPEANMPKDTLPPEGEWKCIGSSTNSSGAPPTLRLVDELFKKTGEQGSSIELEGGRTVSKREENKTWRWVEIPEYEAFDAAFPSAGAQAPVSPEFRDLSKPLSNSVGGQAPEVEDVIPSLGSLLKHLETADDAGGSADDFFALGRSNRNTESSSESSRGYPSLRHNPAQGSLQREMERRAAMEEPNLRSGSLGYAAPSSQQQQQRPSRSSPALGTDAAGFFVPKPAAGGLARRLQKSEKSVLSRRRQLTDSSGILEDA
eukprot:TRINITY_DN27307_c0_g1_i1.p1 TRINITY_DN27307_c0_g1~~TRINITY_DN27307_c0_g1_i1.p1  ORF type:complete len:363 (-),score=79.44 TRINITY_DN27307_c0_g1_i1:43-1131(-)